jgi:glycosyltransferase involved in cell wall biosynthesis
MLRHPLFSFDLNFSINFLNRVVRKVNFDVIFAETSIVSWLALRVSNKLSIPLISDIHGLAGAEAKGRNDKRWYLLDKLEAEVFRSCDHLLVVSTAMKNYIVHRFKIPSNKVTVIPNGSEVYSPPAKYSFPMNVIYAGSFSYWEKVQDYLEIAKNASRNAFKFFLLGDGPLRESLLLQIKRENIPIRYLGYAPRSQVLKIMSGMQIGIAPSTRDLARIVAFPIKVLDYMACGLPVIAPKVGGWSEIIGEEDCGIVLKDDKIEYYLEALEILKDKKIWMQKSQNCIKTIRTKYNWNQVLSPIPDILKNVAKK